MDLSKNQTKLLKSLSKESRTLSDFNTTDKLDISFLGENGLIHYKGIYEDDSSLSPRDAVVTISPKGTAVYEQILKEKRRWLVPVIISVVALIISICAIFSSSQSVYIYMNNEEIFHTNTQTEIANVTSEK